MPPLKPNATVPVPAPTPPSSTGPPRAFLIAEKISVMRQNRGDSCPHIVATNQRLVTDRNTTYVGDGVQRSRLKHANNDACFASAWPRSFLRGCLSHDQNRSQQY